jgi:F1F0 ATPase subunit 2
MSGLGATAAGVGLGLLYFGGLWLSVRLLLRQPKRTAWLAASHAARFATLGLGFAVLSRGGAGPVLAALLGLWLARTLLVCRLGGLHHGS